MAVARHERPVSTAQRSTGSGRTQRQGRSQCHFGRKHGRASEIAIRPRGVVPKPIGPNTNATRHNGTVRKNRMHLYPYRKLAQRLVLFQQARGKIFFFLSQASSGARVIGQDSAPSMGILVFVSSILNRTRKKNCQSLSAFLFFFLSPWLC